MNSPTSRSASLPATITAGKPTPSILCLPPSAEKCMARATENGLPVLRRPLPPEIRSEIHARMATIETSMGSHASDATIMSALALVSSMPRQRGDSLAAELRVEVWCSTLQDSELVGVLPDWAVTEAARAFVAGLCDSKWMPSVGEFLAEVKRRLVPVSSALIDMRQILDAPVEVELSEAERTARREKVAAIMATLGPAPVRRDVDPPSDWDRRRTEVLPIAAEADARSVE